MSIVVPHVGQRGCVGYAHLVAGNGLRDCHTKCGVHMPSRGGFRETHSSYIVDKRQIINILEH